MTRMSIGAFSRLTGVSERAIRLYEQHGLLRPNRTESGRRVFSEADMRRLLNVVALRAVGCSLKEIVGLAHQDSIDVGRILALWIESIEAQQDRLAEMRRQLESALETIGRGETMPMDALCSLLARGDAASEDAARKALVDRWFSPTEQVGWRQANSAAGPARIGGPAWGRLVRQAENAIERRIPPESAEGAKIGAECAGLMDTVRAGIDPSLWNRGAALMKEGAMAIDAGEAQRMHRVYEWLSRAVQHHRSVR